jgi:hypothetical protein
MTPEIRPITSEDLAALQLEAAKDDHQVWFPTHTLWKDGELVGYISDQVMPVVNLWLHSKKLKAKDSLQLLKQYDEYCKAKGQNGYVMPCSQNSPFFPKMPKLGFRYFGSTSLFYKNLTT